MASSEGASKMASSDCSETGDKMTVPECASKMSSLAISEVGDTAASSEVASKIARPEGGDTEARPEGGDTEARPEGGDTEARPEGGDTEARPEAGDTEGSSEAGDTEGSSEGASKMASSSSSEGGDTVDNSESAKFHSFIKTVFVELRKDFGSSYIDNLDSNVTREDFAVAQFISVILIARQMIEPLHYSNIILFFRDVPLNKRNAYALLTYHSEHIKEKCESVFLALSYAYSFLDILFLYCRHKNVLVFEDEMLMCCETLFDFLFKEDYEKKEGMAGLLDFLNDEAPEIFDLIRVCYVETGFFNCSIKLKTDDDNYILRPYGRCFQFPAQKLQNGLLKEYIESAPTEVSVYMHALLLKLQPLLRRKVKEVELNKDEMLEFQVLFKY